MARLPRTSAASYALFKTAAWGVLSQPALAGGTLRQKSDALYAQCYTPSLDPGLPAKVALTRRALCLAMAGIFTATGNVRQVRRQAHGGWPVLNAANLVVEYQNWANYFWWQPLSFITCGLIPNPQPAGLSVDGQNAMGAYLHVYANPGRVENNNWRVAFNILPQNIAAAVAAMCPVLDAHADIGHFKVSAPGTVGKPDSLIVYMRKNIATFAGIRAAIIGAVGGLGIQPTFAPMWDEFALGQGEGGEPPRVLWGAGRRGMSFGQYRCFLTAKAFDDVVQATVGGLANVTAVAFGAQVDLVFNNFGLPPAQPEDQQLLNFNAATALNTEFMQDYAVYDGQAANHYTALNAVLTDR